MDGNTEERKGTISLFNGPEPQIEIFEDAEEEARLVARGLADRINTGCQPDEIAIFVRSAAQLPRAESAAKVANLAFCHLDHHVETTMGKVAISTSTSRRVWSSERSLSWLAMMKCCLCKKE